MLYEILFIIPTNFADNEVQPIVEKVAGLMQKNSAKIVKKEDWGKKKLAYPIKTFRHGYYTLIEIDLEPSALKELNRELRLMPEVLRYQITKKIIAAPVKPRIRRQEKEDEMEEKIKEKLEGTAEEITEKKEPTEKKKISMEDLDKKLDEILDM